MGWFRVATILQEVPLMLRLRPRCMLHLDHAPVLRPDHDPCCASIPRSVLISDRVEPPTTIRVAPSTALSIEPPTIVGNIAEPFAQLATRIKILFPKLYVQVFWSQNRNWTAM
jgi:hypothetical protein